MTLPMPVLDTHCHFWDLSRGDYDWLNGSGGPLAPIRRDFLPADFPAAHRVIAVQAAATLAETDFLLELAAQNDAIAGVVGWVDLTRPGSVTVLQDRAANPLFKGIRPMLQNIADTDWLMTQARPEVIETVTRLGLRFDALVTERHLPMLERFVAAHPDLPVMIDHCAKPQPGARPEWEKGMRALARHPRVMCKFSGLPSELSPAERVAPQAAVVHVLSQLLEWFGPERLVWGSDWPVLTLAASYLDWQSLSRDVLAHLPQDQQAAIFHGNGARFYGI
ncbi:amidohydrolase family protein [Paracoccus laeviglucosivorans]|uniref:L-fuconolactonase n=1 Tax=Paracoccus laeviglucosivorans TaxID=1197861 RepID=A0A521EE54_9RHOB|nr:amidohydrolase family protein [Paracoccus laeviglucosivorans]SMO82122.1 L-fuconolactonase [Paracoccus laeviglucosivorans]